MRYMKIKLMLRECLKYSQIYNISVDDNDFKDNFTEIMELRASDIHDKTAYSILKPY